MKKILKLFLLTITMIAYSGLISAQNTNKQRITREQLAVAQARHIAEEVAMDEATSNKFIETYCQYQKEIWALGPRVRRNGRPNSAATTDADTGKNIEERFAHSQKLLNIRQKYYAEYSKFLTQKQIERVYELERQIMKRLSKHRNNVSTRKKITHAER